MKKKEEEKHHQAGADKSCSSRREDLWAQYWFRRDRGIISTFGARGEHITGATGKLKYSRGQWDSLLLIFGSWLSPGLLCFCYHAQNTEEEELGHGLLHFSLRAAFLLGVQEEKALAPKDRYCPLFKKQQLYLHQGHHPGEDWSSVTKLVCFYILVLEPSI